jgi:hypothetical protein
MLLGFAARAARILWAILHQNASKNVSKGYTHGAVCVALTSALSSSAKATIE